MRLTLRVVRLRSLIPSRFSRWRIVWLSAEGDTSSAAAAAVKLRCSATFEKASAQELKPHKIEDTLAFMWESRFVFRPTRFALGAPQLQKDYDRVWDGFRKNRR